MKKFVRKLAIRLARLMAWLVVKVPFMPTRITAADWRDLADVLEGKPISEKRKAELKLKLFAEGG
jgi:hypothetical protein